MQRDLLVSLRDPDLDDAMRDGLEIKLSRRIQLLGDEAYLEGRSAVLNKFISDPTLLKLTVGLVPAAWNAVLDACKDKVWSVVVAALVTDIFGQVEEASRRWSCFEGDPPAPQFLLHFALRRLKLAEPLALLRVYYTFSSVQSAHRIWGQLLALVSDILLPRLLVWLSDAEIAERMPQDWQLAWPSIRVLWDGTHFPIDHPLCYLHQYLTWSEVMSFCHPLCALPLTRLARSTRATTLSKPCLVWPRAA